MLDLRRLDRVINPKTVAVVGDSRKNEFRWLKNMSTFQGRVYSVHVNPETAVQIEAMGIPNYTRLTDIPDQVDYVLFNVPRRVAPSVLRDAAAKGVGGVTMFTSGFAETDTEEGRLLQESVVQIAAETGLVVIGPNCMGVYNSALGLRFGQELPVGAAGEVTLLSQSGSHASSFIVAAGARGVPLGKAVSFGNGVVLENPDFLEYFAQDQGTRAIVMYIEGVRDGRRFFRVLRETAPRKPVLVWKGGLTDAGRRATASHTNSLAGARAIWGALCRQAGAIQVGSMEEALDVLVALAMLPPFTGRRCGLTGGAGGQSVSMADDFCNAGFEVPPLTPASNERLATFFSLVGASYPNPVDMGSNRQEVETILDTLGRDGNVDLMVVQLGASSSRGERRRAEFMMDTLVRCRERTGKPVAVVLFSPDPLAPEQGAILEMLRERRLPSYPTYQRAAGALMKVSDYYRYHSGRY